MLRDAEVLVKVVECGNFSAAAKALDMAVSSVSRRINKLEQRLGTPLFYRNSRNFQLTTEGKAYYSYIQQAIESVEKAEHAVRSLSASSGGVLKIAAPGLFSNHLLAPVFASFLKDYPNVTIKIIEADESTAFSPQDVDIMIYLGDLSDSELIATPIKEDALVMVCSRDFLTRQQLERSDREGMLKHYIFFPANYRFTLRNQFHFDDRIAGYFTQMVVSDSNSAYSMVKAGVGVAILPRFVLNSESDNVDLVMLDDIFPPQPTQIHAVFNVPPSSSPKISQFMAYVARAFQ